MYKQHGGPHIYIFPSIATSIAYIFPHAFHGICGIHLYFNIAAKFKNNDTMKVMFWKTYKAYPIKDFDVGMKRISWANVGV